MNRYFMGIGIIFSVSCGIFVLPLKGQTTNVHASFIASTSASNSDSSVVGHQAEELFQEALKAKREGNLEKALALFESSLKMSPKILSQNDEGLIQKLKSRREEEFAFSPGNPESINKLRFVYTICLGEPKRMLPFLKRALAATNEPVYKRSLQAQIVRIEQEISLDLAMKKDESEAIRLRDAKEAEVRQTLEVKLASTTSNANQNASESEDEKDTASSTEDKTSDVLKKRGPGNGPGNQSKTGKIWPGDESDISMSAIEKSINECESIEKSLRQEIIVCERELDAASEEYSKSPTEENKKIVDQKREKHQSKISEYEAAGLYSAAFSRKRDGDLTSALSCFELALGFDRINIPKKDFGLMQGLKERRKNDFLLTPADQKSYEKLKFVYLDCLKDYKGIILCLKTALEASNDTANKDHLRSELSLLEGRQKEVLHRAFK
ncbi:MAG: hypothetical protein HQM09_14490 [Candidatus Riflebacteria bacterium]|nr:hypothetical protein [Candidatus Riflebacteria bacterium]